MTPWGIIVGSIVLLAADYIAERYLRSSHPRKLWELVSSSRNPLLRNLIRSTQKAADKAT
jgi:hypothetical protein